MSSGNDILSRLTKKVNTDQKDVICILGSPGCGKTSLASEFVKAQFVTDGDDKGFSDLVRAGLVDTGFDPIEAPDWDSLVAVTNALADPKTDVDCETVVFENLGGFQLSLVNKWIANESAKTGKSKDIVTAAFMGWGGVGFKSVAAEFSDWFKTACSITERTNSSGKHMRVIIIAHSGLYKDKNPTGEPGEEFYRVDIDLHPELQKIVHRNCGNIGWIRSRPLVIKDQKGGVGRALAEDIKEIVFHPSANATAKNRWGLGPEPIPMGTSSKHAYTNLVNAIVSAKKRTQTQTGEGK